LLSNTNAIHFPFIQKNYPILRHFDGFVLSYEVGSMKRTLRSTARLSRRSGCRPECFFADDVADNVLGARREGIDAAQFFSYEQLKRGPARPGNRGLGPRDS
jgi:FMN phosphatase YigB (HAD superfamily)